MDGFKIHEPEHRLLSPLKPHIKHFMHCQTGPGGRVSSPRFSELESGRVVKGIGPASAGVQTGPKQTERSMEDQTETRFEGTVDHIAVQSEDLEHDVAEYRKMGFRLETM